MIQRQLPNGMTPRLLSREQAERPSRQLPDRAESIEIPPLLDDSEVAKLLGYRDAVTFRRHRRALEATGFPERRPIVKRYSPTEIRAWIDGNGAESQQSAEPDPLLGVAGQWGTSK